jgi:hypothetical protein
VNSGSHFSKLSNLSIGLGIPEFFRWYEKWRISWRLFPNFVLDNGIIYLHGALFFYHSLGPLSGNATWKCVTDSPNKTNNMFNFRKWIQFMCICIYLHLSAYYCTLIFPFKVLTPESNNHVCLQSVLIISQNWWVYYQIHWFGHFLNIYWEFTLS